MQTKNSQLEGSGCKCIFDCFLLVIIYRFINSHNGRDNCCQVYSGGTGSSIEHYFGWHKHWRFYSNCQYHQLNWPHYFPVYSPANGVRWLNVVLMLSRPRRWRATIKTALLNTSCFLGVHTISNYYNYLFRTRFSIFFYIRYILCQTNSGKKVKFSFVL